ncbi:MAG: FHA domain-containing protein [Syntrophobacterales bacterium]
MGRTSNSDFVIDHPAVLDRHAQIFFHQDHYWVKDLTGQNLVMINRQPISTEVALAAEDELALSPQGPIFRFLGGGRFAEVEE